MRLKRWLNQRRFRSELNVLKRRGRWGSNCETIRWLSEVLLRCQFIESTLEKRERIHLETYSTCIDQLLQKLILANEILFELGEVEKNFFGVTELKINNLDGFLVNLQGLPIRPEEVVKDLAHNADRLCQELQLLYSSENNRYGYYYRHFQVLLEEVKNLTLALLASSDDRIIIS